MLKKFDVIDILNKNSLISYFCNKLNLFLKIQKIVFKKLLILN